MRLNQFQFLVELKSEGSFSKVAKKLLISQPSISRAIKELENELGYLILKRSKKGVSFTEQGELILENAIVIMEKINNIEQTKYVHDQNIKGHVKIGSTFYICDAMIPELLVTINEKYPKIKIQLKEDCTNNIIKSIANNELDIGVIMMYDSDEIGALNEIVKNELNFFVLFNDEVLFCVGPTHPIRKKNIVQIKDVLEYQYVTCADKAILKYTNIFFKKFGCNKEIIEIRNRNSLRKFVMASDSITAMPKRLFYATEMANDSLIPINVTNFYWGCKIGWIHKKDKLSLADKRIIDELIILCNKIK